MPSPPAQSSASGPSSKPNPRWNRFGIIGFTMIIVVIPFCLYYLFFVSSQRSYFSKRNFRVLAGIGDHISSKIDNLATNLVFVAQKAKQDKSSKTKVEGKNKSDITKVETKEVGKPVADVQKVKEATDLVPTFKFDPVQYSQVQKPRTRSKVTTGLPVSSGNTNSSSQNASRPASNTNAGSPGAAPGSQRRATAAVPATGSEGLVTMNVKPERGSFWLYLEYRGAGSASPGNIPVESNINALFEPIVSRFVIDELNETKERLFDEVLVAEQETGRVIFERGPAGMNVVTLDSLLNDKGGKLELKLADQSSALADVQLAGADYKLFLQPVRLPLLATDDENNQGVRWVVCGLTRTDHFRDETFAVSYTVLISFMFVVLLAVLSWPLLKLLLMGPKDRLRRADLGLTLLSALMGTALVTFILLDLHTYYSLNHTLDGHLVQLSQRIQDNFREELGRALDQLRELNTDLARKEQSGALRDLEDSKRPAPTNVKSSGSRTPLLSGWSNILADGFNWEKAPYPYFNTATWTDSAGQQRIRWATRSDTTAFIDVSTRQFFKNTRDGNLWKLPGSPSDSLDFDYCLEPLRSKVTGENVAVIATRVPGSPWVSSLDTRLLSLMGPVLPASYGYAVIESSGQVLFHSDDVKNLEEQFFAECENDRPLRAAVLSRVDRPIDTEYLGKGHSMYVSALAGTPWTLVVFRDKQMARTMNLELITLSLALYLLFALIVILLFCLPKIIAVISGIYLPRQGEGIRWLWPDPDRNLRYGLLIVSNVLIAGIFFAALKSGFFLVSCFVLPLLAAALGWLIIAKDPTAPALDESGALGSRKEVRYRLLYATAFTGLLALVSVLPAWGFFHIARNFELRLMIKHGQVSIARALEQRTQRVAAQYASIKIGEQEKQADRKRQSAPKDSKEKKAEFLKQRLDPSSSKSNFDVYDTFFFDTKSVDLSQFNKETPGGLDWLLLRLRPLYNQSCVESQGLAAGASSDRLWQWTMDGQGNIFLEKHKEGREERSVMLESSIPTIVAPDNFASRSGAIVAIALPLFLIFGLVRFVARRFFLLDMDLPKATALSGSYVLLRSSMTPDGNKWDEKDYYRIDLSQKDWPAWTMKLSSDSPAESDAHKAVVLDNFEHCMDDPAASREKLLAIEYLLKAGRRVVVSSTLDPMRFSFTPKSGSSQGAAADQLSFSSTPKPGGPVEANNGNAETIPSTPVSTEGKQNGAADLNGQALIPYLPQTDIQARWSAVFTSFATVFAADDSTAKFVNDNSRFVHILRTRKPWRYIETIERGMGIAQNGTLRGMNGRDRARIEELISQVGEQARAYHESLWETISEGQRCTLIQLAQDGMICAKNKHLRRLVKRGLVFRDPQLRLMDESFRRFVISVSHEEDVEAWRRQEGGSAWQLMRVPLLLILVSVALFLFITQKDVYDSSINFMSAITAGIAALFKLLGMFQRDKGGAIQS